MNIKDTFYRFRLWLANAISPADNYMNLPSQPSSNVEDFVGMYNSMGNSPSKSNYHLSNNQSYKPRKEYHFFSSVRTFLSRCWNGICWFVKKIWKWVLGIAILAGLCTGGYAAYTYYEEVYLPEKRLTAACDDLLLKWSEGDEDEKINLAWEILSTKPNWGHPEIPDSSYITDRFATISMQKSAYKYLEDLAYNSNGRCQFILGQFNYWGRDYFKVDQNYTKAAYWYGEAVKNNYPPAYNSLAMDYLHGNGVKQDKQKGIDLLRKGAELNEPWALCNLGDLYRDGVQVENGFHYETYKSKGYDFNAQKRNYNDEFVREYYDHYAGSNYVVYRTKVVDYKTLLYKDIDKAKELWQKSASLGHDRAKERLQQIY